MKRTLLTLLVTTLTLMATAQSTARKLTLANSADGQSEITVYLPSAEAAAQSGGRAIVDCPGGGYSHLSMDNEGHHWAEYFNSRGIAYVVLKYRMPAGDRNIPLSDAYNAMITVRDSASRWNIDPHRVGIMGFSAGGHLASSVCTHAQPAARPDFALLFYPVVSMIEAETHKGSVVNFLGDGRRDEALVHEWTNYEKVDSLTPPTLLLMASDDKAVPVATNGALYFAALCRNRIQCEMHSYPSGGHGFGFRDTYAYHDRMLADIDKFLKTLK